MVIAYIIILTFTLEICISSNITRIKLELLVVYSDECKVIFFSNCDYFLFEVFK